MKIAYGRGQVPEQFQKYAVRIGSDIDVKFHVLKSRLFDGYGLIKKRHEIWNGIEIYRIPLIPRGSSSIGMIMNYLSFMINGMIFGKLKK